MKRLHPEASVSTPIKAAETGMGAVKVWNAHRPTCGLVMVALMMREGWNSWARQSNWKFWLGEGRKLRMGVMLLVMVGSQMWRSEFWRVDSWWWWKWGRKVWRMDLKTGVDTAVKAARRRVGAIQVGDTN